MTGDELESADLNALLARHAGDGRSAEGELEKLCLLAPNAQQAVLARLRAIDGYLSLTHPSLAQAEASALAIGMGRDGFYRLIRRMRAFGPALGLAPHAKAKRRPSAPREGLGELAEAALSRVLERNPAAPLGEVATAVQLACAADGGSAPSVATIRRRLSELRKPGTRRSTTAWPDNRIFGRRVLVDQCGFAWSGKRGGPDHSLCLIVDMDTRLILGWGSADFDDTWQGLLGAVSTAHRAKESMNVGGFRVTPQLEAACWVVPNHFANYAEIWASELERAGKEAKAISRGPKRHGQRLVRLLGTSLDTLELFPRALGGAPLPAGDRLFDNNQEAERVLERAVARWNYEILEAASGEPAAHNEADRRKRLSAWSAMSDHPAVAAAVSAIVEPFEKIISRDIKRSVQTSRDAALEQRRPLRR